MENTIQFIEVVKRHEAIYDTTHKDYKNMERKANAWKEVAAEVGLTVEACKRKWKNLRDSYTKYLRSFRTGTKTSRKYQYWAHATHMEFLRPFQGPGRSSQLFKMEDPYDKFEHMEFLRPFQGSGRSQFKLEDFDDSYKQDTVCDFGFEVLEKCSPDEDMDILDTTMEHHKIETPPLSISTKPMLRVKDLDATSMFFLSLAKSVRNMPKKYQASIKMQCMKIVTDAEIEIETITADNVDNADNDSNMSESNGPSTPNNNAEVGESPSEQPATEVVEPTSTAQVQEEEDKKKEQDEEPEQKEEKQQDNAEQQQQGDNSEHFLYVMSPSKVEAMIDESSEEDN